MQFQLSTWNMTALCREQHPAACSGEAALSAHTGLLNERHSHGESQMESAGVSISINPAWALIPTFLPGNGSSGRAGTEQTGSTSLTRGTALLMSVEKLLAPLQQRFPRCFGDSDVPEVALGQGEMKGRATADTRSFLCPQKSAQM